MVIWAGDFNSRIEMDATQSKDEKGNIDKNKKEARALFADD